MESVPLDSFVRTLLPLIFSDGLLQARICTDFFFVFLFLLPSRQKSYLRGSGSGGPGASTGEKTRVTLVDEGPGLLG